MKSEFARLFEDVALRCVERFRDSFPIHWDYYPNAPEQERWHCWLGAGAFGEMHFKGSSGEQALRRLHEYLGGARG